MEQAEKFLTKMYRTNPDFVFTVTRDFVRQCQTPVLILPDDIPAHPYAVAMESAMLAPNAEVSLFPWKEPKERVPLAVRQIRSFLRAHRPAHVVRRMGRAKRYPSFIRCAGMMGIASLYPSYDLNAVFAPSAGGNTTRSSVRQ